MLRQGKLADLATSFLHAEYKELNGDLKGAPCLRNVRVPEVAMCCQPPLSARLEGDLQPQEAYGERWTPDYSDILREAELPLLTGVHHHITLCHSGFSAIAVKGAYLQRI